MIEAQGAVIHIRFEGKSVDIPVVDLDFCKGAADAEIVRSVAGYLDVAAEKLTHYVVDRHETGNLTIRPEAVFG